MWIIFGGVNENFHIFGFSVFYYWLDFHFYKLILQNEYTDLDNTKERIYEIIDIGGILT